jgi:DNA-binding response OmpR family regulator
VIGRILLAEDDETVRRAISNALRRAGYDVTAVDDGAPAIALADTVLFDIVIADLNMTTVGGAEVVRHYKRRYGIRVCCVVLSGDDDEVTSAACYAAGADDVLVKPIAPTELRERLFSAVRALRGNAA